MIFTTTSSTTNWKITENDLQNGPQNVTPKRGWALWGAPGAPLAPQPVFLPSSCSKRLPKCSKRDPQVFQKATKMLQKWPPGGQSDFKWTPQVTKVPLKLYWILSKNCKAPILQNWLQRWPKNTTPTTTALQCCPDLAWRTARSAYNNKQSWATIFAQIHDIPVIP